jgi:hypothetical protein
MNNGQGIKYEYLTEDQRVDYGFRVLSLKEIESMKKRVKVEYVPVNRPVIGD